MTNVWVVPVLMLLLNIAAAAVISKPSLNVKTLLFYGLVLMISLMYPYALYDDYVNPLIGANIGLGLAFMFAASCTLALTVIALVMFLTRKSGKKKK
ncbi:hypothetical protein ACFFJY_14165 [Fictibacillus aquaticus]|uniref:Uncharacterized protein n=1 Tax=Fictibacillus aquaticus TaxID=2021314 RepID=A0A235FDG9_9BACL|nr:hypothetical protein [Fictibacillus aquaticus]OYD59361.1 hypothetical protein CGZ90_05585 [Fictibacillus aquaticus]